MTLQKLDERRERVEREYKKWEKEFEIPLDLEFMVKSLLNLQEQFNSTSDEHTKTKMDLLKMINEIQGNMTLTKKKREDKELSSRKILFISKNICYLEQMSLMISSLFEEDEIIFYKSFSTRSFVLNTVKGRFDFAIKDKRLIGKDFDLCIDIDALFTKNDKTGFVNHLKQ